MTNIDPPGDKGVRFGDESFDISTPLAFVAIGGDQGGRRYSVRIPRTSVSRISPRRSSLGTRRVIILREDLGKMMILDRERSFRFGGRGRRGGEHDDDCGSVSTGAGSTVSGLTTIGTDWSVHRTYRVPDQTSVLSHNPVVVETQEENGETDMLGNPSLDRGKCRTIHFATEEESEDFLETMSRMGAVVPAPDEGKGASSLISFRLRSKKEPISGRVEDARTTLLVEIVGATGLISPDLLSASDPYVAVYQHRQHGDEETEAAVVQSSERDRHFSKKYLQENAEQIHKTDHLDDENDPIWTVLNGSLFCMKVPEDDLTVPASSRPLLTLVVNDVNLVMSDKLIGMATLTAEDLVAAMELEEGGTHRRISVPLYQEPKSRRSLMKMMPSRRNLIAPPPEKQENGILNLRFKRATLEDEQFVKELEGHARPLVVDQGIADKRSKFLDIDFNESYGAALTNPKVAGENGLKPEAKLYKFLKKERLVRCEETGVRKLKVKPRPDPRDPAGTEWMTKPDLEERVANHSTRWLESGSGDLGRIHLEILRCSGLPNLDNNLINKEDKTDSFVCAVLEDSVVQTEVVNDTLGPMWPPWCQRAFILRVGNPRSPIHLGVFDFDKIGNHEKIGRVEINLSNFVADTVYTLTYRIFTDHFLAEHETRGRGTIQIRLRIEWLKPPREVLLAATRTPYQNYVNVKKKKTLHAARFTCNGPAKIESGSENGVTYFFNTLDEIWDYGVGYYYILDAIKTIIFWRSHTSFVYFPKYLSTKKGTGRRKFTLQEITVQFPTWSAVFYVTSIVLLERPYLFPSFFFAYITSVMLGVQMSHVAHPSPWKRCNSFLHFLSLFVFGKSPFKPKLIASREGLHEGATHDKIWETRLEVNRKAAEIEAEIYYEEQMKLDKSLNDIGSAEIETKKKRPTIDPLTAYIDTYIDPYIDPWRPMLDGVLFYLRLTSNVITWEESYISFFCTLGFAVLSFVTLLIPWKWVILWTSRFVVYSMGPWMKYVDIKYIKPFELSKKDDLEDFEKTVREKLRIANKTITTDARLERERVVKIRDMKMKNFGKYVVKVPKMNLARYRDTPLPESSATPYSHTLWKKALQGSNDEHIVMPGQRMHGNMILKVLPPDLTIEPTGKLAKQTPNLVLSENDEHCEGAALINTNSIAAVVISIAAGAALTTFGAPMMSNAAQLIRDNV